MPAVTPKDVLRYELGKIYEEHRQVLPILDRMETQTGQPSIRQRLRQHREETLLQIENLHRCFELLGTDAPRIDFGVVRALEADGVRFREESPGAWAIDVHNLQTACRFEFLERAGYSGALELARALAYDDVRRLLEQNVMHTHSMMQWIEAERATLLAQLDARVAAASR